MILVAMKPLSEKSYEAQAKKNGKGVTWLDDCRIPYVIDKPARGGNRRTANFGESETRSGGNGSPAWYPNAAGRFPANLLVSGNILENYSRFFSLDAWAAHHFPFLVVPKPSRKEGNTGLDDKPDKRNGKKVRLPKATHEHPTATRIQLMSYLIVMASRPGDVVLDCFRASGPTAVAAKRLGRRFIGIGLDSGCFGATTKDPDE